MHLCSSQFIVSLKSHVATAKCFGLGIAISATAFVGQANAQIDIRLSDSAPQIPAPGMSFQPSSASQPIVQLVNRYNLDQKGNLNGQVAAGDAVAGQAQVFLMQNKRMIQKVSTNEAGEFTLIDVDPGRYSIVAAGNNHMGAQGIMVDRIGSDATNDFFTLAMIKTEYKGVQELVANTLPKQITNQIPGSVMQQVSVSRAEIQVATDVRIVNGKLRGQVVSLFNEANVEDVQVHLLQNNQPVAQVETDALGTFTVSDAEPGYYDLVATGRAGFAAMRIKALGKRSPMTQVSYSKAVKSTLTVALAEDCPCGQTVDQPIDYDASAVVMEAASQAPIEYASESIGCGGACGGCGGNAGNFSNLGRPVLGLRGGGGGLLSGGGGLAANAGGLSRLLTLGSIAGAVVAIADDDDAGPSSPSGSE